MKWPGLLYSVKQSIFSLFSDSELMWTEFMHDLKTSHCNKLKLKYIQLVSKEGTVLQCGPYCTDHSCVILLVRERPLLESYVFKIFKHSELLWCNSQILYIINLILLL